MATDWNELSTNTDFLDELLNDNEPKKPVAIPAFDPFEEVEVIDSRHLFKPSKRKNDRTLSGMVRARMEGAKDIHYRPDEESDILCSTKDSYFIWTTQRSEITCWACKTATPEERERREGVKRKLRHDIKQNRKERKDAQRASLDDNPYLRHLTIVQDSFQGIERDDFFA